MADQEDTSVSPNDPSLGAADKAAAPVVAPGHRRSTTGEAQAQRIAWGKEWGQVTKAAGKRARGDDEK